MGHIGKQYQLSKTFLKGKPNVLVLPVKLFKKETPLLRSPPRQLELEFSNAEQPLNSYIF